MGKGIRDRGNRLGGEMIEVRKATEEDAIDIIRMSERAYLAGGQQPVIGEYDPERMEVLVAHLLNNEDGEIFIAKRGDEAIGMVVLSMAHVILSATYSMAQVITWYVEPEDRESGAGKELLESALGWARARNVDLWVSAPKASQSIAHMCVKRGFKLLESIYIKGP